MEAVNITCLDNKLISNSSSTSNQLINSLYAHRESLCTHAEYHNKPGNLRFAKDTNDLTGYLFMLKNNVLISYASLKKVVQRGKSKVSRDIKKRKQMKKEISAMKIEVKEVDTNKVHLREREWFRREYERLIGKPPPRKEVTEEEVIKSLRLTAKFRCVTEAKRYVETVTVRDNIEYVEWRGPLMEKCACPDKVCICKGNTLLPSRIIPKALELSLFSAVRRYDRTLAYFIKRLLCMKSSIPEPSGTLLQRLAMAANAEAAIHKELNARGVLNIKAPEFCLSKCHQFLAPGYSNYLYERQKLLEEFARKELMAQGHEAGDEKYAIDTEQSKNREMEDMDKKDVDEDDRICDEFSCTVSNQTYIGPDGEFIIGKYSHLLFGTVEETVLKDIEGTKLQISTYKCKTPQEMKNVFRVDKFTLQEFKHLFSKVKCHIYSSIFEIQDPGIDVKTCSTQIVHEKEPPFIEETGVRLIDSKSKEIEMNTDNNDCGCCNISNNSNLKREPELNDKELQAKLSKLKNTVSTKISASDDNNLLNNITDDKNCDCCNYCKDCPRVDDVILKKDSIKEKLIHEEKTKSNSNCECHDCLKLSNIKDKCKYCGKELQTKASKISKNKISLSLKMCLSKQKDNVKINNNDDCDCCNYCKACTQKINVSNTNGTLKRYSTSKTTFNIPFTLDVVNPSKDKKMREENTDFVEQQEKTSLGIHLHKMDYKTSQDVANQNTSRSAREKEITMITNNSSSPLSSTENSTKKYDTQQNSEVIEGVKNDKSTLSENEIITSNNIDTKAKNYFIESLIPPEEEKKSRKSVVHADQLNISQTEDIKTSDSTKMASNYAPLVNENNVDHKNDQRKKKSRINIISGIWDRTSKKLILKLSSASENKTNINKNATLSEDINDKKSFILTGNFDESSQRLKKRAQYSSDQNDIDINLSETQIKNSAASRKKVSNKHKKAKSGKKENINHEDVDFDKTNMTKIDSNNYNSNEFSARNNENNVPQTQLTDQKRKDFKYNEKQNPNLLKESNINSSNLSIKDNKHSFFKKNINNKQRRSKQFKDSNRLKETHLPSTLNENLPTVKKLSLLKNRDSPNIAEQTKSQTSAYKKSVKHLTNDITKQPENNSDIIGGKGNDKTTLSENEITTSKNIDIKAKKYFVKSLVPSEEETKSRKSIVNADQLNVSQTEDTIIRESTKIASNNAPLVNRNNFDCKNCESKKKIRIKTISGIWDRTSNKLILKLSSASNKNATLSEEINDKKSSNLTVNFDKSSQKLKEKLQYSSDETDININLSDSQIKNVNKINTNNYNSNESSVSYNENNVTQTQVSDLQRKDLKYNENQKPNLLIETNINSKKNINNKQRRGCKQIKDSILLKKTNQPCTCSKNRSTIKKLSFVKNTDNTESLNIAEQIKSQTSIDKNAVKHDIAKQPENNSDLPEKYIEDIEKVDPNNAQDMLSGKWCDFKQDIKYEDEQNIENFPRPKSKNTSETLNTVIKKAISVLSSVFKRILKKESVAVRPSGQSGIQKGKQNNVPLGKPLSGLNISQKLLFNTVNHENLQSKANFEISQIDFNSKDLLQKLWRESNISYHEESGSSEKEMYSFKYVTSEQRDIGKLSSTSKYLIKTIAGSFFKIKHR